MTWASPAREAATATPLTSHIAIMGRTRMNSRNRVKNRPKLPTRMPTSMIVGR